MSLFLRRQNRCQNEKKSMKVVWHLQKSLFFSHQICMFLLSCLLSLHKFSMSNSPSWDFVHLVDHVLSRYMTSKFKAFSVLLTRVHCSIILESFRSKN